ncbi:nitrous oxide reductase accessory protein NosL [Autumnicola musiva]|uniref:Nitrous oxide reductase accessory protein NosL n=1 Tax=Autumnicola musiva TaxID=3075589 RepID=A0ABU3DA93_9FLAO|nr:nitrous oxide reductase accessory protein NosL [Zunongwangia sp. F117]MDT0678460.1 nitrous oxide reductase accessory protein NosL [Zunongwangia sp. F117]
MKTSIFSVIIGLIFISCEVNPQPIDYGNEACEYCKMTIVDKQHASQLVNTNGKVYNFDAIECMINYSEDNKGTVYQLYLINDFQKPGTLIDAKTASFLISPEVSSPMGASLSGFASKEAAKKAKNQYSGEVYNWTSITNKIR